MSIKLELTGPTDENPRTEVFEAKAGPKSLTYKNEEFGNVDHENVFTFEVTDKEAFSLLGPNTKVKLIVEPENPTGNQINITEHDVYNPYKNGKEIEFEYSKPMVVDLIPVVWEIPNENNEKESIFLENHEVEAYKTKLEQTIRSIMPITISDGTDEKYLIVNALVPNADGKIKAHNGNIFIRPTAEKSDDRPFPFVSISGNHLLRNKFYYELANHDMPYDFDDDNNNAIFKMLLVKAKMDKTFNSAMQQAGMILGTGFASVNRISMVFADPDGELNSDIMNTAIHELGHNLGSQHAPVRRGSDEIYITPGRTFNDVDADWHNKMHFQGSLYEYGRLGVPGYSFNLDENKAGVKISNSWQVTPEGNIDLNNNRDVMGLYNQFQYSWVSDRNFAQWSKHLNSDIKVRDMKPQTAINLPITTPQ
ncbi:MAG: hypothetical protein FWG02_11645 [Holophagaceae bacterium]|nr:hypothetical protein [Holophagaceae bacterium]